MSTGNDTTRPEIRELPFAIGLGVGPDGSAWTRKGTGCKPKLFDEWRPLKQAIDSVGYPGIGIRVNGQTRRFRTHVLVLTMFVGPCPEGQEALHFDDDKTNNAVGNLRWGTRSQNMKDCVRNKTHVRGPGKDKLTPDDVRVIRRLGQLGKHGTELAPIFGVSASNINAILNERIWNNVD